MWRATAMIARITCSTITIVSPRCDSFSDQRNRLIDLRGVEPRHHLVQQQDARLRRQRARHFQPALVDGGEVLGGRLFARGQPDEVDRLARLLARGHDVAVAQEGAGHDIGKHGHRAERLCDLEGACEAERTDVVRPQADDFLPECQHGTGIGVMKAGDEMKARGLAGAVRPDQRDRLVLLDGEADVLHGAQAAEALAQALHHKCIGHGDVLTRAGRRSRWRCQRSLNRPIKPVGRHRMIAIRIRL